MKASNNVFFNRGEPVKRYKAAVPYSFSGKRFNGNEEVFFILDGSSSDYDQNVLEIYSPEEDRFLRYTNKTLFEQGCLVPFTDTPTELALHNAIDDDEVNRIALVKTVEQLKTELAVFDSVVPVERIFAAASTFGRTVRFLNVITEKLDSLRPK